MKKTNIILAITLIVMLVIGTWGYVQLGNERAEKRNYQQLYQEALEKGKAEPLTIRDTIVDTVAGTISYVYNPVQTTDNVEGYVSKGLADTLALALKVATKTITRLESMVATISAAEKADRVKDSVTQNEWLVMRKDPVFDVKVNLETDSIFTKARIGLAKANAPYRKNIFSRYEYRSVIMARDPRVEITEVFEVNKVPKSPRWSIGVTAGPLVSPQGLSWGASLGLTYDLIQF
ncbi:MAG TPA: hypothetical protein H9825_09100 [Candidatus Sphingobacterium stercorigallinarum]|nr:hypothetical protein [Candidatus Sphingobacterium stercorigallinarum]